MANKLASVISAQLTHGHCIIMAAYVNCDASAVVYSTTQCTDPAYISSIVQSIQYRITNYLHSGTDKMPHMH